MQANELRTGNYVLDVVSNEHKIIYGISHLEGFDLAYVHYKNEFHKPATFLIQPIPFTEDWLKKFGFKKEKISSYDKADYNWVYIFTYDKHHYDGISIAKIKENGEFYIFVGEGNPIPNDIKYVHELQNLNYALTGKELILNNK
jgi:hypothetical protein